MERSILDVAAALDPPLRLMLKKKLLSLAIELTVILSPLRVFYDINILFFLF